jgi:hypothetical protein
MRNRVADRRLTFTRRELLASLVAAGGLAAGHTAVAQTGLLLPPAQEPFGYNILQNTDSQALVQSSILTNPFVTGVVLRRRWSALNPSPGVFNWNYFDQEIARAKSFGKQVQLLVFTGVSAPSWLYAYGAQPLRFQDPRYPGMNFTMPVPWDPIMLGRWQAFVSALGARYDTDPTVSMVHAAGPCRFSCEMFLPSEVTGVTGWSYSAIIGAWTQVVGFYNMAFPSTAVSFNLSHAVSTADGLPQAVAALANATLLDRATLQLDSLSPHTSSSYDIQALLIQWALLGTRTGYEMLSASNASGFNGPFASAVAIALESGGQYVNLYPADLWQLAAPY